jgi:hypothetical protein
VESATLPITLRATPATTGNRSEQLVQPTRTKKYVQGECKTDSSWPKRERRINWRADRGHRKVASVNTSCHPVKSEFESV